MNVVSSLDGSQLIELRLEGVVILPPREARLLLDLIANSGLADYTVMRVGATDQWIKLASRWGSAVRYGMEDSRDARRIDITQIHDVTPKGNQ